METAVIMMGIQGSGKSTFCNKCLPESLIRISLDEVNTRNNEQRLISNCISEGQDLVIDNTNPAVADRQRYIPILKKNGYKIIGYFMQSRIKECVLRNEQREGKAKVPSVAIAATSNKLELPSYSEGFDELFFVRIDNNKFLIDEWEDDNEV